MSTFIYLIIAISFLLFAFLIVKIRMIYLNNHPDKYVPTYDGHALFLDKFFFIVKFTIRNLVFIFMRVYRNILHFWVRIVAKFSNFSDKIYMQSRNKFMEEVVKDKKAVPHFWNHLKKYKKEIEEERGEEELNKEGNN